MNLTHRTLLAGIGLLALAACGTESPKDKSRPSTDPRHGTQAAIPAPAKKDTVQGLPGMPPVLDPKDVYAADRPNKLSPSSRTSRPASTSRTPSPTPSPSSTRRRTRSSRPSPWAASPSTSSRPGT